MASAITPTASAPAAARDSSVSSSSTAGGRPKQFPNGLRGKPVKSQPDRDSDSSTSDQHLHDRLLFLLTNCIGFPVTLAVQSGHKYSGIFSGASLDSPDNGFVLKMAKKIQDANGAPSAHDEPYTGHGDDHVMVFARDDMVDLHAVGVTFDKNLRTQANGSAAAFRTDTDISGNRSLKERELQPWQPTGDAGLDLSFDTNGGASWDQFEVNKRLYGVTTDYDESMYTTQIDRSAPSYKERAAVADRVAREIEGSAGGSHQAREDANDMDEEARFSGVQREPQPLAPSSSSSANRYTLPARRAPTGQPTVSGAPVDPAIISAQLARPDSVRGKANATPPATQSLDSSKKENVPAAAEAPVPEAGKARDLTPIRPTAVAGQSRSPNATETVEADVLKSFRDFSAGEKIKVQAHQRAMIKRDKEVKLNDLKKFAANFKLPRPVPEDMLGILAKDKRKQEEIMKKSQTEAEAKKSPTKTPTQAAPDASSSGQQKPAVAAPRTAGDVPAPVPVPIEPANQRGAGRGHGPRNGANARNDKGPYNNMGAGRGMPQGTFGQRKLREYGAGHAAGQPGAPPTGPAALQTDVPVNRTNHAPTPSSAASSRFNVGALEFRPNPTASTFSPSLNASSVTSQSGSRPVSKAHSPTKKSFFEGQRPGPASEQKSIRDGFNPIKRMKAEAQAEGKTKDFAQNDGIPPPFTTRPTWDTTKENEDKGYMDMFDKASMPAPPTMPGLMAHQHQLPPHLQQGMHGGPHYQGPQHAPRFAQSPMHHHGQREHYFEDNRMQYSTSQPGMYGSPRAQPGMMMQHSPMSGAAQPVYMQPQPMYVGGQPMVPYNAGRAGQMPPPMMGQPGMHMAGSGPQGGQFMVPAQPGQMMYSPGPGQIYPAPTGPQTPASYPSPRPPPMMAHQGSQQGHAPQMMYPSGSQQGQPVYFMPPQSQPMNQMRGGYPMQQQGSFNASPHMQYQHPMQAPRGPQQYGNYPQQHMQGMHPQPPPPTGSDMK